MTRIFTTPNIMQRYVADPISYYFISTIKENNPDLIIEEYPDRIYLKKDPRLVSLLKKILKRYSGFRFINFSTSYKWIHPMRSSIGYTGSKLVVSLEDRGSYYKFSTSIVLGKKRSQSPKIGIFGWLAAISFFTLILIGGTYEADTISTIQFIILASTSLLAFGGFSYLEQKFNPFVYSDE